MAKGKRSIALFEVMLNAKNTGRSSAPRSAAPEISSRPAEIARPKKKAREAKAALPKRLGPSRPLLPNIDWNSLANSAKQKWQSFTSALTPICRRYSGPIQGTVLAAAVISGILFVRWLSKPRVHIDNSIASIESLRLQKPDPSVLDVTAPPQAIVNAPVQLDQHAPAQLHEALSNSPADTDAQPATSVIPAERQITLNYIIVQSYGDEKTADDARDFLASNGIPCTVEHGLPKYNHTLYHVVTLQGFEHPKSADCDAYSSRIRQLSQKFAAKAKGYKAFDPLVFKWTGAD
jgi:hypothetical protein